MKRNSRFLPILLLLIFVIPIYQIMTPFRRSIFAEEPNETLYHQNEMASNLLNSLIFSTYLGGNDYDRAQGCTTDNQGYIYIHGNTHSLNLPTTPGVFDRTHNGDQDAFVAKVTPDGSHLVWLTYLGGSGADRGYGLEVDTNGNVYLVGITTSFNFPTTPGAFDRSLNNGTGGGADVFVTKLSPDGSSLVYSTYIGGSNEDWSRGGMAIDNAGNVYVGGLTRSSNFPTTRRAFQRTNQGNEDGFLLKLSADGSNLIFSSLIGGSEWDSALAEVSLHSDGTIYIGGMTNSQNFPTTLGAYQRTYGGGSGANYSGDGFVARFTADGSNLIFSTYLGGSGDDIVAVNHGLAIDSTGRAIANGNTTSYNFPTSTGAFQKNHQPGDPDDGFITVLSADGQQVLYSTYIGGTGWEEMTGLTVDTSGFIYTTGATTSNVFPITSDAYQPVSGGGDSEAFFTKFKPDLTGIVYSTFLGGSGSGGYGERGRCLVFDPNGNIIISGDTNSSNFPTTSGVFQKNYQGSSDGFIAKFAFSGSAPPLSVTISGPMIGFLGVTSTFYADVGPGTTQIPIDYDWQATGQPSVNHTNSLRDSVSYTWNGSGVKTINLTASNVHDFVTTNHQINIITGHKIFLPLVSKN